MVHYINTSKPSIFVILEKVLIVKIEFLAIVNIRLPAHVYCDESTIISGSFLYQDLLSD